MKDRQKYIQSLEIYLQASELFSSTIPLQCQIYDCNCKLRPLIGSHEAADRIKPVASHAD